MLPEPSPSKWQPPVIYRWLPSAGQLVSRTAVIPLPVPVAAFEGAECRLRADSGTSPDPDLSRLHALDPRNYPIGSARPPADPARAGPVRLDPARSCAYQLSADHARRRPRRAGCRALAAPILLPASHRARGGGAGRDWLRRRLQRARRRRRRRALFRPHPRWARRLSRSRGAMAGRSRCRRRSCTEGRGHGKRHAPCEPDPLCHCSAGPVVVAGAAAELLGRDAVDHDRGDVPPVRQEALVDDAAVGLMSRWRQVSRWSEISVVCAAVACEPPGVSTSGASRHTRGFGYPAS